MKTKTAPKSHQAERSEAQPQSPLAEAPPEEISEARLNQLAKDYGPSIERAIAVFNREIEHYLFGDHATEPVRAQPKTRARPTSTLRRERLSSRVPTSGRGPQVPVQDRACSSTSTSGDPTKGEITWQSLKS
jgi:hypothetical protein